MSQEQTSVDRCSREVTVSPDRDLQGLFGHLDRNLRMMEQAFQVEILARGSKVAISGPVRQVERTEQALREMERLQAEGYPIDPRRLEHILGHLADGALKARDILLEGVEIGSQGRRIGPKSPNQKIYLDAMRSHDLVVGIGPAGTGKTYLAMAMAVHFLQARKVKRIILARPAVEAGESLGYLPGDMIQKVNPYLRPLYDALYDLLDVEKTSRLIERGLIEVAPIAYMRGRTLNDSFIILDEAQNTTSEQMKMFLTRMGFHSRAVVTGDITQIDLPPNRMSGLVQIQSVLEGTQGIQFVRFNEKDVVRHDLVQQIIRAYNEHHAQQQRTS